MFQGRYTRWNPIQALGGKRMFCEAVHDDWEGFRIWLRPDTAVGAMVIVSFSTVLYYGNSLEGRRLAAVSNASEMQFPHVFWIVEESALVTEFKRQAAGTADTLEITHYAFLSSTDCIDVLATMPPRFEVSGEEAMVE